MDKWIKAIGESNIKQHLKDEIVAALHTSAKVADKKPAYSKKPKTDTETKSVVVKGYGMPGGSPHNNS